MTHNMVLEQNETNTNFFTGLLLAIQSTVFIGSSFVIQKKALLKLNRTGGLRASAGGYGYLKEWLWWLGLITMGIGELANFAAYAFAPASLVTPLGAISILVSAVLSSRYLNEKLSTLGIIGCCLCVLGTTLVIVFSPKQQEVDTLSELVDKFYNSYFVYYAFLVLILSLIIAYYIGPKFGHKYVITYVLLCSAVGSLIVMACKGLGLAVKEFLSSTEPNFNITMLVLLLVFVIFCILIQMNYLNKALDLFNTNIVTPVYYVFFTTLVLTASAILFKEWRYLSSYDIFGCICGFFILIIAIFCLTTFKNVDTTLCDVYIKRSRQELLNKNGFKTTKIYT